jgi:hypothetical protein
LTRERSLLLPLGQHRLPACLQLPGPHVLLVGRDLPQVAEGVLDRADPGGDGPLRLGYATPLAVLKPRARAADGRGRDPIAAEALPT